MEAFPLALSTIDISIITIYILAILTLGIYCGRKIYTIRHYAIDNGKFLTPAIFASVFATWNNGITIFGISEKIFIAGVAYIVIFIGQTISLLIISEYIIPKIFRFKGLLSGPEIIGEIFGQKARIISAIFGILHSIGALSIQIIIMNYMFQNYFGIDPFLGNIMICGAVILYSAIGGIRATLYTDFIQFLFLILVIPVVGYIILAKIGGYTELIEKIPDQYLNFSINNVAVGKIDLLIALLITSIPLLLPDTVQRILITKDQKSCTKAFRYSSFLLIPFYIVIGIIVFSAFITNPEISPNIAFPYLINNLLPPILKNIVLIGMLFTTMSSIDSILNTASTVIVHDIINPINKNKINIRTELILAKLCNLILGFLSIVIITPNSFITGIIDKFSLLDIGLVFMGFWLSFATFPLIFSINGMKISTKGFMISGGLGLLTYILYYTFDLAFILEATEKPYSPSCLVNIVAPFVNIISYLTFYIIEKKRFYYKNNLKYSVSFYLITLKNLYIKIKTYFPTIKTLNQFSTKKVELFGAQYMTFAAFASINYIIPYFMWSSAPELDYFYYINIIIRVISGILCAILFINEYWPKRFKKYLPIYWYFTLMFCLIFHSVYMFLEHYESFMSLLNISFSLFILFILVDWLSGFILLFIGTLLSLSLFCIMHGYGSFSINTDVKFMLIYISVFSIAIGITFSGNREFINKKLLYLLDIKLKDRTNILNKELMLKRKLLNNVQEELRNPIQNIMVFSEGLHKNWRFLEESEKNQLIARIHKNSVYLDKFINNIKEISLFDKETQNLRYSKHNITVLISNTIKQLSSLAFQKKIILDFKYNDQYKFLFDYELIQKAIYNIIHTYIISSIPDSILKIENYSVNTVIGNSNQKFFKFKITRTEENIDLQSNDLPHQASLSDSIEYTLIKNIIYAHNGKLFIENNSISFAIPIL